MKQMQNPFPGLRPFGEMESHLFFGRQNHVDEILRILDNGRFVSVVGNSGSGKSSLIRAGVLPRLVNSGGWKIAEMRPGGSPLQTLAHALIDCGAVNPGVDIGNATQILKESSRGILQLTRKSLTDGKKLLLLVDQFEELFRFRDSMEKQGSGAEEFAGLLIEAIAQMELPVYIMISLRSDFLGDCEQFSGLPEAINKGVFLIPRLNIEELRQAITGPVEYAGAKISPVLVQKLVYETGNNPDQLPLLQHALMRTWELWYESGDTDKPLDDKHYLATGGLADALSRHADEAFSEISDLAGQELTERVFKALTYKGSGNRGIRRPLSIDQLSQITGSTDEEIIRVTSVFRSESRGFILPSMELEVDSATVLDISHESLMRVWGRLVQWVDEEAESAELYQALANSARQYEKDKSGLWRDPDLQRALDWREKYRPTESWALRYHSRFHEAMKFLNASEQHARHLRKVASRNRQFAFSILIVVIVALSSLSLWAFAERQNSVSNANVALSEKQRAEKQRSLAEEQKLRAEENLLRANAEEKKALAEQAEAERQRNIAVLRAEETRLQKLRAERASLEANDARRAAELDRKIAVSQKLISDSLRIKAENSEKNARRLRMLGLAQNAAINSRVRGTGDSLDDVTLLLALQAYKFHRKFKGDPEDPVIFDALYRSLLLSPTHEPVFRQRWHSDAVKTIAAVPGGNRFISGGDDGQVFVQQPGIDKPKRIYNDPNHLINCLALNGDGSFAAWAADDNRIYMLNLSVESDAKAVSSPHPGKITDLLWTPAGIVSASSDYHIRCTNPATGKFLSEVRIAQKPLALGILSASQEVVVACENGDVMTLNVTSGKTSLLLSARGGQVSAMSISPDEKWLALGFVNGNCAVYQFGAFSAAPLVFSGHAASITAVSFCPGTNKLATAGLDGRVIIWNPDQPGNSPLITSGHQSWVLDVTFTEDGMYVVSCGKDKKVCIVPASTEKIYELLKPDLKRNFTRQEWYKYIGTDIDWESTME